MSGMEDLAELLATPPAGQDRRRVKAIVLAITGNTLTLTIGGSAAHQPGIHHLASYTPTVGDVVWVDFQGSDPLVLGTEA